MGLSGQAMAQTPQMKFIKIKISADLLAKLGHPKIFEHVSHVEVFHILQYDLQNFFLLATISFPPNIGPWRQIPDFQDMMTGRHAVIKYFFLLNENQNSIQCLIKLSKDVPFWPLVASQPNSPWALLPPVMLDPEFLHLIFIVAEEFLPKLNDIFSRFASSFEILAQNDLRKEWSTRRSLGPEFTGRQIEVARYAFRNGYFHSPKGISAQDIAEFFKISPAAVTNHLRKATMTAMQFFFS